MAKSILDSLATRPDMDNDVYHTHSPEENAVHFVGDAAFSAVFRGIRGVVHAFRRSPTEISTSPTHQEPIEATYTELHERK